MPALQRIAVQSSMKNVSTTPPQKRSTAFAPERPAELQKRLSLRAGLGHALANALLLCYQLLYYRREHSTPSVTNLQSACSNEKKNRI